MLAKESRDHSLHLLKNSQTSAKAVRPLEKVHDELDSELEEAREHRRQQEEIQEILFPKNRGKSECLVYTKPVKRGTGDNKPMISSLTRAEKAILDQLLALP